MKILIFEYINGGGFSATDLPAGLAHEGLVMLNALLDDLIADGEHEISLLLEQRCLNISVPETISIIPVNRGDNVLTVFNNALSACEAAWPIAPESSQILFDITCLIEASGKCLLSSSSSAVAKTADKLETFTILSSQGIATINTHGLEYNQQYYSEGTVIKPRDGVGCENSYFIDNIEYFNKLLTQLDNWQHYIIQPYIKNNGVSAARQGRVFQRVGIPLQ